MLPTFVHLRPPRSALTRSSTPMPWPRALLLLSASPRTIAQESSGSTLRPFGLVPSLAPGGVLIVRLTNEASPASSAAAVLPPPSAALPAHHDCSRGAPRLPCSLLLRSTNRTPLSSTRAARLHLASPPCRAPSTVVLSFLSRQGLVPLLGIALPPVRPCLLRHPCIRASYAPPPTAASPSAASDPVTSPLHEAARACLRAGLAPACAPRPRCSGPCSDPCPASLASSGRLAAPPPCRLAAACWTSAPLLRLIAPPPHARGVRPGCPAARTRPLPPDAQPCRLAPLSRRLCLTPPPLAAPPEPAAATAPRPAATMPRRRLRHSSRADCSRITVECPAPTGSAQATSASARSRVLHPEIGLRLACAGAEATLPLPRGSAAGICSESRPCPPAPPPCCALLRRLP